MSNTAGTETKKAKRSRAEYLREYRTRPGVRDKAKVYDKARAADKARRDALRVAPRKEVIGIDGEGLTEAQEPAVEGARPDPDFIGPMPRATMHRYLYLAAWSTKREVVPALDLDRPEFISRGFEQEPGPEAQARTKACFDFLLSLPQDALVFGFSLGYDYTKILEGLPNEILFDLTRPERRPGAKGPLPRRWGRWAQGDRWGDYSVNYVRGKLSVRQIDRFAHEPRKPGKGDAPATGCQKTPCMDRDCRGWCKDERGKWKCHGCKAVRRVTVWDIFAFFQTSFIKACDKWRVVDAAEFESLREMKDRRSTFTRADWEAVKTYCGQECRKLAALGEKLLTAHEDAGLKLTSYHGAGSTSGRMLTLKFQAKKFIAPPPAEMNDAVAGAFFGGRFEVSRVGIIRQAMWSNDIASAYPYQFADLPCLVCGRWEFVAQGPELQRRIEEADIALVRYELPDVDAIRVHRKTQSSDEPWGPFPFRARDDLGGFGPVGCLVPSKGSIVYPVTSGGGWVYKNEFLAGQKHFPNVVAAGAWVYARGCADMPFRDGEDGRETMAAQYIRRLQWETEGGERGQVLKLGMNGCFGKAAQSIGSSPPFQSFVWAGMVTSGCRAQLLDAMACAKDRRSILMTATDALFSLENLKLPKPRDTGTAEAARIATEKGGKLKSPLGAWEPKRLGSGMVIIRPGIGFPLDAKDINEADIKARGIGKSVLTKHREMVLAAWLASDGSKPREVTLPRTMFFGMKSATDPAAWQRLPAATDEQREARDRAKFAARKAGVASPTRRANYGMWEEQSVKVSDDPYPKRPPHRSPEEQRAGILRTWAFSEDAVSAAYSRAVISPEALAQKEEDVLQSEQPDREDLEDDLEA